MPILALKNNPPSRFPEKSIIDSISDWWVAKVFPRQEKALAFDLLEMETEYYLPLYTKVVKRKDNGKSRKSIHPLFPSYVPFVCEESPYNILQNRRVATVLKIKSQEKFKRELQQIYCAYKIGFPIEPYNAINVQIGADVEVFSGPMKGTQGKVIKVNNNHSILLSVDGLGKAVLNIDAVYLRDASKC